MPPLKPWYQVVTPREDLRENRPMDASEFAVHLDHIREGRENVSKDYSDPVRFFDRTYLTESLLDLCAQVVRRLSGVQVETSAVYNMATQFGGGKTHALTTTYHLARHGDKAKSWKGVERILGKADVTHIPKAHVAVFVGTEFDVIQGRGGGDEPVRKTPWGEIAWQLGGEKALAAVAEHDRQGLAPAGDALRAMLPSGPTLILMDELLNYVSRGRKVGMRDQFFNLLQNLSEEARARKNLVLCVSIPASELHFKVMEDPLPVKEVLPPNSILGRDIEFVCFHSQERLPVGITQHLDERPVGIDHFSIGSGPIKAYGHTVKEAVVARLTLP